MKKSLALLLVAMGLMAALAATGCGDDGDDNDAATTPTTTTATTTPAGGDSDKGETNLQIAADKDALAFDKDELSAKAGKVTIVMDNPSTVPHSVSIEGNGVDEQGTGGAAGVGEGEKSTVSANLKAGSYTYYCPVDAHEQAGMKGTLTVK